MSILDTAICHHLHYLADKLEKEIKAHIFTYYGGIRNEYVQHFRNNLEDLVKEINLPFEERMPLAVILHTPGGVVEAVEQMVNITRHHFEEVWFIVPDMAMSAGTIFCMSGNRIFMDYSSALGPIDPQVQTKDGKWVPALGYLDQYQSMIEKSENGGLSDAEYSLLMSLDLAMLRRFEQAKDLSVELLKTWLVKYKFSGWKVHRRNKEKLGEAVSDNKKVERAKEIAIKLGDNKIWHSHGRSIGIEMLKNELKLEIDDYTDNISLREAIHTYTDLISDYVTREQKILFIHHKDLVF